MCFWGVILKAKIPCLLLGYRSVCSAIGRVVDAFIIDIPGSWFEFRSEQSVHHSPNSISIFPCEAVDKEALGKQNLGKVNCGDPNRTSGASQG